MRYFSLSTRLFLSSVLVSSLLFSGIYFYLRGFEEKRALIQAERAFVSAQKRYLKLLNADGRSVEHVLKALAAGSSAPSYQSASAELSATGMSWVLISPRGELLSDLNIFPPDRDLLAAANSQQNLPIAVSSGHYLARAWQDSELNRFILLYSLQDFEFASRELLEAFFLSGLALLMLSAFFARFLTAELIRPFLALLTRMRSLAHSIGIDVPETNGDEIRAMSKTYIEVAQQLQTAFMHKNLAMDELQTYKTELLRVNSNLRRRLFQVRVLLSLWTERDKALDVKDFLSHFLEALLPGLPFEYGCIIIRPIATVSSETIFARKIEPQKPDEHLLELEEEQNRGTLWTDILDVQLKEFLLREGDACIKLNTVTISKVKGALRRGAEPTEITVLSLRLKQGDDPLGSMHFLTETANPQVPVGVTDFLMNLSAQVAAQLQIHALSSATRLDSLTRLYNRGYLNDRLREEVVRSTRTKASFSLLFVDIDHFKELNENHGRQAGDEVLRGMAALLKSSCRGSDAVCRYSGTVMAIMLVDTPSSGARVFAENLRKTVEMASFPLQEGSALKVTVSLGLADFPGDAEGVDELIRQTEQALLEAKKEGRNRWKAAS